MLSAFAGHAALKYKKDEWKMAENCKICKRHFDKKALILAHHWFRIKKLIFIYK